MVTNAQAVGSSRAVAAAAAAANASAGPRPATSARGTGSSPGRRPRRRPGSAARRSAGAEDHQRAGQPEQRAAAQRRAEGDVARRQHDVRGIAALRSRSNTVSVPSARRSVENSGLSRRYEPWQAMWMRSLPPNACEAPLGRRRPPTSDVGAVVQHGERGDLGGGVVQTGAGDEGHPFDRSSRRWAIAHPVSDGVTEIGPAVQAGKHGPRQAVQHPRRHDHERPARATTRGGSRRSASAAPTASRVGRRGPRGRRALHPVEAVQAVAAAVDVVGQAVDRAELVQRRPVVGRRRRRGVPSRLAYSTRARSPSSGATPRAVRRPPCLPPGPGERGADLSFEHQSLESSWARGLDSDIARAAGRRPSAAGRRGRPARRRRADARPGAATTSGASPRAEPAAHAAGGPRSPAARRSASPSLLAAA